MTAKKPEPILPFTAEGLIAFYNIMYQPQGFSLAPHMYPVANALMDERITHLLILLGPGGTKSSLTSVAFPAFMLGQRPSTTILGTSAGEGLVQGFQKGVMDWIEWHPAWKILFPHVRPDKDKGWSSERGLYVTGHEAGDPDASYFTCGIDSSVITGKHAKIINIDDIHNRENSATVVQCEGVRKTWYNTLMGRANPQGARYIASGRRWHQEDVYGHWKESGDWVVMELPSFRKGTNELYWDVTVPKNLVCCFNERVAA